MDHNASEFPVTSWGESARDLARNKKNEVDEKILERTRLAWPQKVWFIICQPNIFYLPLGMMIGIGLGKLCAWIMRLHDRSSKEGKSEEVSFVPGARLIASRTLVTKREGNILINFLAIAYRILETIASIMLPLGVVMLTIAWEVVLPFVFLFYGIPALLSPFKGFWKCLQYPALIFVGCRSRRQIMLKLLVTVTLLTVSAIVYRAKECEEDIHYLLGFKETPPEHQWSWLFATGPFPVMNDIAGHVACPEHSVLPDEKHTFLLWYLLSVWCLSAAWVALALADLCGLVNVLKPASEVAADTEVDALTKEICTAQNAEDLQNLLGGAARAPVSPLLLKGKMCISMGMAFLDMFFLDFSQLLTWLWALQFKFCGCLICIFAISLTLELSKGTYTQMWDAMKKSMARGIMRSLEKCHNPPPRENEKN